MRLRSTYTERRRNRRWGRGLSFERKRFSIYHFSFLICHCCQRGCRLLRLGPLTVQIRQFETLAKATCEWKPFVIHFVMLRVIVDRFRAERTIHELTRTHTKRIRTMTNEKCQMIIWKMISFRRLQTSTPPAN